MRTSHRATPRLRHPLVAVLLFVLALVAVPSTATPAPTSEGDRPVVLVGMTGVRWDDTSAASTPHLFTLLEYGSTGNLISRSVRSTSCPVDGWLAVSAGRRAADLPMERYGTCRALLSPGPSGVVPGWSDFLEAAEEGPYDAVPGLLGSALAEAGATVASLGPGAAIALAGPDGVPVGDHDVAARAPSSLADQVAERVATHDLTVVDIGGVRDRGRPFVYVSEGGLQRYDDGEDPGIDLPGTDDWILSEPTRAEQVSSIDARLGAVLDAVAAAAPDAVVVVTSLSDSGTVPRMQVAAMLDAGALPGASG
ncbi:MAG: hypothetical protein EOL89_06360, partial [Actinobacteria bacterium]|nr:hypothetical protein [Actinomycetota bacterium]